MQTKTFDSLPAQTYGEERKGFWKSSGGTQNMDARFHFCAHWFGLTGANSAFRPWALFE
jgi:hypothetical protein